MSNRILGLIDYGNGAGPKPKGAPPAPKPERTPHSGRVRRIIAGQTRPAPTDDEMYEFLLGFARRGERAPTLSDIEFRVGHGADRVLRRLVKLGRLSVEVGLKNYRVIRFVADNVTTLQPADFKPYRRVNKDGDFWCGPNGWRPRDTSRMGRPSK